MPHSTPATPFSTPPSACATVSSSSSSPSPSQSSSPADLHAHGLALFRTIFELVRAILASVVRHYSSDPEHDCLHTVCLVFDCLTAVMALEYTLHAAPERITPRQLLRLSQAARALTRLTGQTFDFTPWTSLTPSELDRISPKPTPNPLSEYRLRPLEYRMPPSGQGPISLLQHPGATLANVIKKLIRILPSNYSPESLLSPSPSQSPSQSISSAPAPSSSMPSTASIPSMVSTLSTLSTPHSTSHGPP